MQVIGWSMWFSEYLFLERSWAKDESTLKLGFQRFRDFPLPFWLALFVEGTGFTQAKLLAAQEFAASMGLPVTRNVLIPRTKVDVDLKRHLMKDLPETDNAVAQCCRDAFVAKDKLLEKHIADNSFGEQLQDTGWPLESPVVVISWASLLTFGAYKFFHIITSILVERSSAMGLAIVTVLMQILIQFS
ncbi:unnamed protein product [Fraxinus pennsylvanica]|uniref:1-acylglycerol-3-phosphate O-acyltransferase n=1 Tax=Fraxinus pennsylvanica TaxID=56036 RepID=A0AAD2EGW5_9LAMI|nr:unnamed protein product [Fraxinus pennsylvanica]